jgi:predicted nucleic acid-binding protein
VARYLLDTDVVVDYLKDVPSTIELIDSLYSQGEILCICDIVVAEVYAGLPPAQREIGRTLLGAMQFLLTTERASRQAGMWRYDFRRRGIQLPTTDSLIAAVAYDRQATVVTGNLDDYPMPQVSILPLPRRL